MYVRMCMYVRMYVRTTDCYDWRILMITTNVIRIVVHYMYVVSLTSVTVTLYPVCDRSP